MKTLLIVILCAFSVMIILGMAITLVGCDHRTEEQRLRLAEGACDGKLMYTVITPYNLDRRIQYRNFRCIPDGIEVVVK